MRTLLITLLVGWIANATQAKEDILTTAARAGSFKTLVSCVVAADLDEVLQGDGHFTVFAPTDEAFAKLPEDTRRELLSPEGKEKLAAILKYHVLGTSISIAPKAPSHPLKKAKTLAGKQVNFTRNNDGVTVNGSRVVQRNINCSNGIIHAIDQVLIPPASYLEGGILDVASKTGNFKTLLAAARAAGLIDALNGEKPLTIFAPTDKAFSALPKGTLETLLKPANKGQLAAILKLHVVSGEIESVALLKKGETQTLSGERVTTKIETGQLKINSARVLSNDIRTANGIIHAIDSVLLPSSENGNSMKSRAKEVTIKADSRKPVSRDGIRAERVIIQVSGGGSVNLTNLQADEVIATLGGGARVELNGTAGRLQAKLAGGSRLEAAKLTTQITNATVYGGAIAGLHATEELSVSLNAGSRVKYVPTGAKIKKNVNTFASFEPYSKEMSPKLTSSKESRSDHH